MKTLKRILPALILLLASCASKKAVVADNNQPATHAQDDNTQSPEVQQLTFVQKVSDNQVYAKDIVGDMSFTLQTADKNITVPGSLHMRKDAVIRIQLFIPLLGSEVGRLEFTPDHVLIVDRMHKEYIQADYGQVGFLRENGISFHTLQALFWNQLFMPGRKSVSESSLKDFTADLRAPGANTPVSLKNGRMTYTWNADKATGRIVETDIKYQSPTHGTSSLNWKYSDFKNVGVKMFPARHTFSLATTATKKSKTATVSMKMGEVRTDSKWDANTKVSPKYKKVEADDILKKLMNL